MRPRVQAMNKANIGKNLGKITHKIAGGAKIVGSAVKKNVLKAFKR